MFIQGNHFSVVTSHPVGYSLLYGVTQVKIITAIILPYPTKIVHLKITSTPV